MRIFLFLILVVLVLVVGSMLGAPIPAYAGGLVALPAAVLYVVALVCGLLAARRAARSPAPPAIEVGPPVEGTWTGLNGPADKVPSHGVHSLGQTFAIDILIDSGRPIVDGWWPVMRPATDFPSFGAPLVAVADATVVRVSDGQRDHRSRGSYPGLVYLYAEGVVRSLAGPRRIFGNHVILDLGGGVHAAYAHIRKGSIAVREGDRVVAGQPIGECGNSGNSSEPHLHFQLMDHPDLNRAGGLPFTWTGVGVPANGASFTVAPSAR
ncbi:M23 family peptidase [Nocardiopsis sp. MG754419]|nr:M23 family peptidase [Nocardiopsis sp. MG754419]